MSEKILQVELSVKDMDTFKSLVDMVIEIVLDERVDKDVRHRCLDELMEIINIKNYHIDL